MNEKKIVLATSTTWCVYHYAGMIV